jgi:hypothetical protein
METRSLVWTSATERYSLDNRKDCAGGEGFGKVLEGRITEWEVGSQGTYYCRGGGNKGDDP